MSRKRGVTAYAENPFVKDLTVTTRKKRVTVKANRAIIDTETGEYEDTAEICQVHQVDDGQFIKLFTGQLKQIFDLTPSTYKMLQVVLHQVQQTINGDLILLDLAVAEKYFTATDQPAMAKTTFHRAVKELIEKQFIAESIHTGMYYINPALFFNGDRVRFVTEYRRRPSRPTSGALAADPRQMDLEDYLPSPSQSE